MDWVRLHLIVNHFPIILAVTGTFAGIAAAISRKQALWRYAFTTVLLAGLTAPVAYITGSEAEETVERLWYVDETQVEEHEELGLASLLLLLAAGVTAGAAWWRSRPAGRWIFLGVTVVATVTTGVAALEGGEIVHDSPVLTREAAGRAPPAPAAGAEAEIEEPGEGGGRDR